MEDSPSSGLKDGEQTPIVRNTVRKVEHNHEDGSVTPFPVLPLKKTSVNGSSEMHEADEAITVDVKEGEDSKDTVSTEEVNGDVVQPKEGESPTDSAPSDSGQPTETDDENSGDKEDTIATPTKRELMPKEEEQALDSAFLNSTPIAAPSASAEEESSSDLWLVKTTIPKPVLCIRLLRRFAKKTRPKILSQYGGTQSRSILGYLFGRSNSRQDSTFAPYKTLIDAILTEDDDEEEDEMEDESYSPPADVVIENEHVMEAPSAHTQAQAQDAIAAFVDLFSVWGHASSSMEKAGAAAFQDLQVAILGAACNLVDYGCLTGVCIKVGEEEFHSAASLLASSVFNSDLTSEKVELASMKFLLGTGCRPDLLRGSYLLQSIRTFYHVYLTTEYRANKVAARAALQQLIMSVFARVIHSTGDGEPVENFPSADHRDVYLVLRSLCKLSMRTLPNADVHSHIGIQTSASNDTWAGDEFSNGGVGRTVSELSSPSNHGHSGAQLVSTSAIHPALESKLLALELMLYVLQNTPFGSDFCEHCGPQFHAAIRNYLCVSLLKNCISDTTRVVSLSLSIFVPTVRHFRTVLKTEIEAFVTNVFFVILDSKNSSNEHKSLVVRTFQEIGSDPHTLAEIFLNFDCDLSAVDLFHRIVNTLSRLSRLQEPTVSKGLLGFSGPTEQQMEKARTETRELRLAAMKALRQILASLHASIVEPMKRTKRGDPNEVPPSPKTPSSPGEQNLVELYGSKKKRRAEEAEAILRFNRKPSAGIAYAAKCGHIDPEDAADVARYLLKNKDELDKTQIGEYLGREAEYQGGFSLKVLHEYVRLMDFTSLVFDDAIRYFLSGFRLPGEAQKIDRIMEKFAERFTEQNPSVFPTADAAFILSFSIIMLNTDLHNPAIKEERRMTKDGFIRNNRGICDGQDLPQEMLTSIFDRIKENPISLKEDDEARERVGDPQKSSVMGLPAALSPASFFTSHYEDADKARKSNFQKERDHIVRTTESLLKRRRPGPEKSPSKRSSMRGSKQPSRFVLSEHTGLKDEYVSPMFEVTWGPALAAFSTAMESANGTAGVLISIASDEELEQAAANAAETIEVCLTGFRFAIGTAGLCGNEIARDSFMSALSRFSQLGTGVLLEPRHLRATQTLLSLAREDGELLGSSWEHIFKALSEINRFHQLLQMLARNDRAVAVATERRKRRLQEKERRRLMRDQKRASAEDGDSLGGGSSQYVSESEDEDSLAESGLFSEDGDFDLEEDMDAKEIDEANAREVYEAVSESTIEAIYERSSSLSAPAVEDFFVQLCLVSRSEISVGTNDHLDLNQVSYRQKHTLLNQSEHSHPGDQFHHTQPNIYNLQKLVEATHYNMASRPRLLFAELWVIVADHLTTTALHSNPAIAMYAVDSFRQLSIQYLRRDELEVFEFQKRFLKPLETIMADSIQTSTKELLLNCVARLIHVFGSTDATHEEAQPRGGLRSGWVPLLTILGLGGRDADETIAQMSFKTLSGEIKQCLYNQGHSNLLLSDYFVETVDAVLKTVSGPHDEVSLLAMEQLVALANALSSSSYSIPAGRRKMANSSSPEHTSEESSKQKLGLWWPVLLGLSRSMGEPRLHIREKVSEALFGIIQDHFVYAAEPATETLQLVYRGVLNSVLEFAESTDAEESFPYVPDDFERLVIGPKDQSESGFDQNDTSTWLETSFEQFMDNCIVVCKSYTKETKDPILIDEVFALLNSCLLSDSGALAVRGLRRLEQFVSSDLDTDMVTDDVWATVSHMLQRSLSVRGLPKRATKSELDGMSSEEQSQREEDYVESVAEFLAEDRHLPNRRCIGSNATMVVGHLLCSERFSISLRWRLFLLKWVFRAVRDWDAAAEVVTPVDLTDSTPSRLVDYRESSMYGRKWMNRLILRLASIEDVGAAIPGDKDGKTNRFGQGQKQIIEATENLLMTFVSKEEAVAQYNRKTAKIDEAIYKRYTVLVQELLSGFGSMDSEYLKKMEWLSPILLSSCIRSTNEEVRLMVQKIVDKTSPISQTPPKTDDVTNGERLHHSEISGGEEENGISIDPPENGESASVEANGLIHA